MVVVCAVALIFVSYRIFSVYRRVFFGEESHREKAYPRASDLGLLEKAYVFPVVLGLIALGVYPKPLLEVIRPTALTLLSMVK
jgi:NADH-quinone oxidoreductase subunit M